MLFNKTIKTVESSKDTIILYYFDTKTYFPRRTKNISLCCQLWLKFTIIMKKETKFFFAFSVYNTQSAKVHKILLDFCALPTSLKISLEISIFKQLFMRSVVSWHCTFVHTFFLCGISFYNEKLQWNMQLYLFFKEKRGIHWIELLFSIYILAWIV